MTPERLREFCAGFAARYALQPPEFSSPRGWYGAQDIYKRYASDLLNEEWFETLIASATDAELETLNSLTVDGQGYQFCMIRHIQLTLLERSSSRDARHEPVSAAIPTWFRRQQWGLPADSWNCEIVAANDVFLAQQDAALAATDQ